VKKRQVELDAKPAKYDLLHEANLKQGRYDLELLRSSDAILAHSPARMLTQVPP
jgi:hypothetical protein